MNMTDTLIEKITGILSPGFLSGRIVYCNKPAEALARDTISVQPWPRFGIMLSGSSVLKINTDEGFQEVVLQSGDVSIISEISFAKSLYKSSAETLSFVLRENSLRLVWHDYKLSEHNVWPPDIQYHLEDSLNLSTLHCFKSFIDSMNAPVPLELRMELLSILLKFILCDLRVSNTEKLDNSYFTWRLLADFVEDNYSSGLTRQELSKKFRLTDSYITKLFRHYAGCTFYEYRLNHQLSQAELLLRKTRLTVAEVADKCGFRTPSFFIKCFKKHFSSTPARYRCFSYNDQPKFF